MFWDKKIETIKRSDLKNIQEERLKEQLHYVFDNSLFYRDKFLKNNFYPKNLSSLEDIKHVPITKKDELREAVLKKNNPLPHLCVSLNKISGFGCSRGTSGMSTFSAFTKEDIELRVECYTRSFRQLGLSEGSLFHSMIGIQSITHFIFRQAAERLKIRYLNDGVDNLQNSIQMGKWLKPDVLLTGVRTLLQMEDIIEKDDLLPRDIFNYEKIILYGDVITNKLIEHIKERWGAKEIYSLGGSAADILWYNFSCPYQIGNHCLNEDMFLVEVIDPQSGDPVKSGQRGELVVTDLCSRGAPHIRWNLEDIVIPFYEPCECGRTHIRLRYIGRSHYMVMIKGKVIFPSDIENHLWDIEELDRAEFRIVKYSKNMEFLKLDIELEKSQHKEGLKQKIKRYLKDRLDVDVEIRFLLKGELPVLKVKTVRLLDLTKKGGADDG